MLIENGDLRIYLHDLKEEQQAEFLSVMGRTNAGELNFHVCPIALIPIAGPEGKAHQSEALVDRAEGSRVHNT